MSRNDQVTRQWHLLRQLESRSGVTLQEIADLLPDDYPKHLRPLRRDLGALETVGFHRSQREPAGTRAGSCSTVTAVFPPLLSRRPS